MRTADFFQSIVLRILTVILTGILTTKFVTAQVWYNSEWQYRYPVTVQGLLAEQYDFQVKITLEDSFDFINTLDDGSDIRVTTANGVTELPFWIEEWDKTGTTGTIWVKVPLLPVTGLTVYLYYGNPTPVIVPGPSVEVPPAGPYTKDPLNPIVPIGVPAGRTSLLAENIVYDDVTGHYWMVLSDQTSGSAICLVYSDDPTNPAAWNWFSGPHANGAVIPAAIAPHIIKHEGTWYIFYGDRSVGAPYPVSVATSASVSGPYTKLTEVLPAGAAGTWEDARADEPYVFWSSSMNKWILIYMGDAGGNVEQIGYATADAITGPYTKFAGNPCIPFGPAGAIDAGTVADPWVYEYQGTYYIGYTVSPTTSSPWQTALATTDDWLTFTKHGLILTRGTEYNSFRGAVTRIGDEYVFSYTGGPASGQYRLCIATQPVYQSSPGYGNDGDAVFDFFDGFEGTILDAGKWFFASGSSALTSVADGLLTLTATTTYVRINGTTLIGLGYVGETLSRHPNQGTNNLVAEVGFAQGGFTDVLRIVDDFPSVTNWQRQATAGSLTDGVIDMNQAADQNWHIQRIYREINGTAGFQIDNTTVESVSTNVPVNSLSPFLMSYGNTNQFIIDWTRVRKWAGSDPVVVPGVRESLATQWTGAVSNDWSAPGNWTAGVPAEWSRTDIQGAANSPVLTGPLTIGNNASLTITPGGALTIEGQLNNNGILTIGSTLESSGSLIVNGTGSGNITFNRQLKPGNATGSDWHLVASPVASNAEANSGKVSTVYQWSELTGTWTTTSTTSALPGRGYNIRQEEGSDGVITFRGPLVNTDLSVEASSPYADAVSPDDNYFEREFVSGRSLQSPGGMGWNLLGNPYPSAISVDDFIAANYNATPSLSQFDPNYVALYLFDGSARRYYYLANSTGWPSGLELNETHIQAGQGFFVRAMNDNSEFSFTGDMREHGTGTAMLKSAVADNRWPGLQLKVKCESGEALTTVVYGESMTIGVDPGYDIGLFRSGQDLDLYTKLALKDNGVYFTRQALPLAWADTIIIPVGIEYTKGGDVQFSAETVPAGTRRFWLEDRVAGVFTELGLKSYSVTMPAKTSGTGRFFIVASSNTPTQILNPEEESGLKIWAVNGKLIIKGKVSEGAVCEIFDMKGRVVTEVTLPGGEYNTVDLSSVDNGIFVVRIADNSVVTVRKVVIT